LRFVGKALALIALVLVLIGSVACSRDEPSESNADGNRDKLTTTVDDAFRPLMAEYSIPGMVVAVTVNGTPRFFTYGQASKDDGSRVTSDTLFEIGSVSKTFTATLGAYAIAQGRMSLADHPGKFMPQLVGRPVDAASLLDFATYTAGGLPLQFPDGVDDDAQAVTYLRDWTPVAPPGTQRQYSNPSIGLFGHVAALAMDGSFADVSEKDLYPKLGLSSTYIRVPQEQMNRYAWGYDSSDKPVRVNPGAFDAEAYGVKTSAADLIRFVQDNIRPDSLEPMLRQAIDATHVGHFRVGQMVQDLGWEQYPYPVSLDQLLAGNSDPMARDANAATPLAEPPAGPALFNKTGSTNGFGAYAAFVPAKGIGIVMLANKNFPNAARVTAAYKVLEQLAAEAG